MAKPTSQLLLMGCFVTLYVIVSSVSIREINELKYTRSIADGFETETKMQPKSCQDTLTMCRNDKSCREALTLLKTKCAVKKGSCNAKMVDFPVCAEIMDKVTKRIFNPQNKCVCQNDQNRCSRIYEMVYENPCFVSMRVLRKKGMIRTLDEPTTSFRTSQPKHISSTESETIIEDLFGPPSSTHTQTEMKTITYAVTTSKPKLDTANAEEKQSKLPNIDDEVEKQFTQVTDEINKTDEVQLAVSDPLSNPSKSHPNQKSLDNDPTPLRIIAIATGALVVIISIGAGLLIYFGWRRKAKYPVKTVTMS